eukprot:GGOE01044476.1.p1 GENE.GGOE01044476.1~~GGOE01044476.1.p1  ORF type:complete len:521 (-),score=104.20 GGOE01044476.1:111-1649(-)
MAAAEVVGDSVLDSSSPSCTRGAYFLSEEEELRARKRARKNGPPALRLVDAELSGSLKLRQAQQAVMHLAGEEHCLPWMSLQHRFNIDAICVVLLSCVEPSQVQGSCGFLRRQCFTPFSTIAQAHPPQRFGFLYELLYRAFPRYRGPNGLVDDEPAANSSPSGPEAYLLTTHQCQQHGFPCPEENPQYLCTRPRPNGQACPPEQAVLAVDCEMCRTAVGHELARVTVVNSSLQVVYDRLVKPRHPIEDYCTQFSGITRDSLANVETRLEDVQHDILNLVFADTILVGHSLQNDLHVLRLIHHRVVDTAFLFPHPKGPPHQPALRLLAHRLLRRSIQGFTGKAQPAAGASHSSAEDATACLELLQLKLKHGPAFGAEGRKQHILTACANDRGWHVSWLSRRETARRFVAPPPCEVTAVESDEAAVCAAATAVKGTRKMVWLCLQDNARDQGPDAAYPLHDVDRHIEQLHASAASRTAFLVLSGQGVRHPQDLPPDDPKRTEGCKGFLWAFVKP